METLAMAPLDGTSGLAEAPRSIESRLREPVVVQPVTRRAEVRGKFLFVGDEKLWVRGVTYGTFGEGADGSGYPPRTTVAADFAAMAEAGLNALRVYIPPPRWLLDLAAAHGLRVMVGVPWEQHVAFLDTPGRDASILRRIDGQIDECIGHPAVFAYAIGNEIPASVVRWLGRRRVERFLARIADKVRALDPGALITYVNFPTTEYLELPFVDFLAFNVYLEDPQALSRYLARLQNLAGERPLLMAEVGLDSRRNGEAAQAETLSWQIETSFGMGCSGVFLFAWTDEWWRGGSAIEDWDFGLTRRDRSAKPALAAAAEAFRHVPFRQDRAWPRISVVVCSYNGSATLEETLQGLAQLNYPDYEVIVVDDGSTDATPEIAARYDVRLISTPNRGLSAARNTGAEAATGEIVAYTDDDAYPDPDWLKFLAAAFERSDHVAMGGPNIAPYGDNDIAECVANAPGGPLHVLLGDELAEHIPGCNMAYRREALLAIGGFDPQFRVAGDDVDVCWRLQERGWTLGFCAAAMVWHHRRPSVSRYLKQQRGYARAEALLAAKFPQKYNHAGHMSWHGRIYGRGLIQTLFKAQRIYHGPWGSALFQSIYEPAPGLFASLPLMPEWYALVGALSALALLGLAWPPLLLLAPPAVLAIGATLMQALNGGLTASFQGRDLTPKRLFALRARTAWLHLLQPWARLQGRICHGIGPWRRGGALTPLPWPRERALWSVAWRAPEERLTELVARLHPGGMVVNGGDFERHDLTVAGGLFAGLRAITMTEEHGAGAQVWRVRTWPHVSPLGLGLGMGLAALAAAAGLDGAWVTCAVLGFVAAALGAAILSSCAAAIRRWEDALQAYATADNLIPIPD